MTEAAASQSNAALDYEIVFSDEEINFEEYVDESLANIDEGEIITGKVASVSKDFVIVDIGYKSQGQIPSQEFHNEEHEITVEIGDEVEIYLESLEDYEGQVIVSKEKADKLRVWEEVGKIFEEDGTVEGIITSRIKGGLSVDIGVKAFLPGSQVDLRPIRNLDKLIGEKFEFKVLKFNQKRGNIVLSRRALLEIDREDRRRKTLEILKEGEIVAGHVKNITDYGIFVDLGGVDGLLHITDMTWGRIVHPSEMYNIGDEIEVMVLKYDQEDEKVSLGLKQKKSNPWDAVLEKYPEGTEVEGKIVSLTNYGAFIELEEGVEGLIHVSEMSWTKKVRQPSSIVNMGDVVKAVVKDLDVERKRISLSMKEILPNPWKEVAEANPIGAVVQGTVRNITDFGVFVGLEEGIDGLVHVSDLSWSQRQKNPQEIFKKGDEITVKILNIDVDKERLSLGIKQLTEDPWKNIENEISVGSEITGTVAHIADFGVFVEIKEGVEGLIHVSEIDGEISKKQLQKFYPIAGEVKAKVLKVDANERRLGLSIIDGPDMSELLADADDDDAQEETPASDDAVAPSEEASTEEGTEVAE